MNYTYHLFSLIVNIISLDENIIELFTESSKSKFPKILDSMELISFLTDSA